MRKTVGQTMSMASLLVDQSAASKNDSSIDDDERLIFKKLIYSTRNRSELVTLYLSTRSSSNYVIRLTVIYEQKPELQMVCNKNNRQLRAMVCRTFWVLYT